MNHNLETVPRLYRQARPGSDYAHSLELLQDVQGALCPSVPTKSGLMVGLGETDEEILAGDARHARARHRHADDRPVPGAVSAHHLPVLRYVHPDTFRMFEREAAEMGFTPRRRRRAGALELPRRPAGPRRRRRGCTELSAGLPPDAAPAERLACGNCRAPMAGLVLDGHYGRHVEIDRCAPCHLVWFDTVESVRLSGTGMLSLLGDMAQAQREPHRLLRPDPRCPRCDGTLKVIHNRTRWGSTRQLECPRQHGVYQTFAQFLSEKGSCVRSAAPTVRRCSPATAVLPASTAALPSAPVTSAAVTATACRD